MAVNLSPVGGVAAQFFTNSGAVLTGGKLYTYAAGTTTPAVTYTSSNGLTAWTNPIVLDAAGRVPSGGEIWLTDGINYKFVLKDANDVLIATYDNISGINSNFVAYTNNQEIFTATAGQTVFTLANPYQPGTNSLSVFVDGVNQYGPGAMYSYVETDSVTVTFNAGLHVGAEVKFTTTQQQGAGAVDAQQVSYDPPFTGSVATNVEVKLAETISVEDFGAVGNGVTNDTTAIQTAINDVKANNGGDLSFSGSNYLTSSEVVVKGEISRGLVINGNDSTLSFTQAGVGFRFGELATPGSEYRLKTKAFNLNVTGPGKATASSVAVKIDETADVSTYGGIWKAAEKGLWLNGGLISDFTEQVIRDNGTGVVANNTATFSPNSINFTGLRIIKNDLAVNYDNNPNGVTNWFGCEIEANNPSGTTTDGKVVTSLTAAGHHNLIGCHFESNKGQTSVKFVGDTTSKHLMILGCEMIDSLAGTGLDVNKGRATILSSRITGVTNINFGANGRGTLIDVEGTPAGTLTNVIGIRDGRIGFGLNPVDVSPLISATSAAIVAASNIVQSYDADTIQYRWRNAAGTRVGYLQTSATSNHVLNNDNASGGWVLNAANTNRLFVGRSGALNIEPGADNTTSCGSASLRWSVVYAANGTINTSDAREKQQVRALSDAERAVAVRCKSLIRAFKFNDAVTEKGTGARIHFGVIAQDLKAAFEAEGLVAEDYAVLCLDKWDDQYDDVVDQDGQPTGEKKLIVAAGERYGVRYEELLAFIISAM